MVGIASNGMLVGWEKWTGNLEYPQTFVGKLATEHYSSQATKRSRLGQYIAFIYVLTTLVRQTGLIQNR